MPADPAPKIECKQHSGYGIEDATRIECRDYKPVNHINQSHQQRSVVFSVGGE
jgi:hypothetical protein